MEKHAIDTIGSKDQDQDQDHWRDGMGGRRKKRVARTQKKARGANQTKGIE